MHSVYGYCEKAWWVIFPTSSWDLKVSRGVDKILPWVDPDTGFRTFIILLLHNLNTMYIICTHIHGWKLVLIFKCLDVMLGSMVVQLLGHKASDFEVRVNNRSYHDIAFLGKKHSSKLPLSIQGPVVQSPIKQILGYFTCYSFISKGGFAPKLWPNHHHHQSNFDLGLSP